MPLSVRYPSSAIARYRSGITAERGSGYCLIISEARARVDSDHPLLALGERISTIETEIS